MLLYLQLVFLMLPILYPTFLSLAYYRVSKDDRSSRRRVKLLEKDESYTERLVHIIERLERSIEDAAIDAFDSPGGDVPDSSETVLNNANITMASDSGPTPAGSPPPELQRSANGKVSEHLSPLQLKIIENLNKLPNMKKELVYIDPVFNSHAVIIARDVKRFKHHEEGWAVLRHLADHFVM